MPLTRLNDGFRCDLDGIYFGMRDGERNVTCIVTYEALQDYVRGTPSDLDCVPIFKETRAHIEAVASAKYDMRGAGPAGSVRIDTRDLNPDLRGVAR